MITFTTEAMALFCKYKKHARFWEAYDWVKERVTDVEVTCSGDTLNFKSFRIHPSLDTFLVRNNDNCVVYTSTRDTHFNENQPDAV